MSNWRRLAHALDAGGGAIPLAMIQDKTRGNISLEEQRLVENSLTELRFRFVQAMEQQPKKPESETERQAEA